MAPTSSAVTARIRASWSSTVTISSRAIRLRPSRAMREAESSSPNTNEPSMNPLATPSSPSVTPEATSLATSSSMTSSSSPARAGAVPTPEEIRDLVTLHLLDRLPGAEDLTPQRVAGEHRLRQQRVHVILGHVEVHEDLFEDHLPLGLELVGPERRVGQHVAQDVHTQPDLMGGQPGVVSGVLAAGEGVHLAPHRVDGLGDLAGRARRRPLEQQVLEEVRRARQLVGLVTPADTDPDPERHRAGLGHALGDHPDAVGKPGLADLLG